MSEDLTLPKASATPDGLSRGSLGALWVGHSTVLFWVHGKTFLTDPMFSKRILFWPRLNPPGLSLENLPPIDTVLISHTHLDHMDRPTLKRLAAHSPGARLILPKGARGYLRGVSFAEVVELAKWAPWERDGLRVTRVPSRHFGGRYGFDNWKRTYGGYVVEHDGVGVYFAGDTGYRKELFDRIGALAQVDLALLPIGAYSPPPIRIHHMDPDDAVRAMTDLRARAMLPIHHSTFILSAEPVAEPIRRLRALAAGRPDLRILTPRMGEIVSVIP